MRRILKGVAVATAAAALLTGGLTAGAQPAHAATKTTLTFWSWVPNMDKIVDVWNKQNPDIQVHYFKVAQGDPAVTKLLTAIKAGSGAPDVTLAEYQTLPELVVNKALANIKSYVPASTKKKFSAGDWSAATIGGSALYGVPEDTGPMAFYYRQDVFTADGITTPPTTWDQYAADAKIIHDKNPSQYIGTFSSADAGQFAGLTQQNGASWWGTSGSSWTVGINSAAAKKVASYWGGLVQSGVVNNEPQYTPQWNKDLADGSQVGWVSAAWAPGVLEGNTPGTAGKWNVAPLPQWSTSGKQASGDWGGSVNAVTSQSKHKAAAAKFVTWLDATKGGTTQLVKQGGLFPSDSVDAKAALATAPTFFPNVPDFWSKITTISKTVKPFTYGPNVDSTYSAFNDDFGKAAQSKSQAAFVSALNSMQSTTVTDLKQKGFKVAK